MTLTIVFAVLFSALLHATWNSLAHAVSDRLVGFALIGVADAMGGGLMVAFAGLPPAGAWPFIIASAALHVVYNLLLFASYQLGEFSQMYPLARGTSPWVVALVSVVVLGRELPITELAGRVGGLGGPHRARLHRRTAGPQGSACDHGGGAHRFGDRVVHRCRRLGVMQAPLFAYTGWLFLLQGPPIAVLAAVRRGRGLPAAVRASAVPGSGGRPHLDRRVHDRAVGADQRCVGAHRGIA